MLIDGQACSASLFDFAIYFYNNAAQSVARGFGCAFPLKTNN